MRNFKLNVLLTMAVLGTLFMSSCGSSRGFEGYYPENRITGKGYGYATTEQPAQQPQAEDANAEIEETASTQTEASTTESVEKNNQIVENTPTPNNELTIKMDELSPREQKWVNRLNLNSLTDEQPKKMGFMDKVLMKVYSKMASRQLKKHYGIDAEQRMDIADIFAIVSLSSGGVAFLTFYGVFLFGIAAIVFGALALKRGTSRRGMAIAGIALGAIALFFWIVLYGFVIGTPWFVN